MSVLLVRIAFFPSVARKNQYRFCSDRIRGFNVNVFVSDDVGSGEVDVQLLLRSAQHARLRFPAIASCFRMVRTEIDRIEPRPISFEFHAKQIMNLVNRRLLEITAADSGLVRDEDCLHATVVDPSNRRAGVAEWFVQAGIIHVSDFFGYRSIPIHEYGTVHM